MLDKELDHVQRMVCIPGCVRVHAQHFVRRGRPHGLDDVGVAISAQLDLENGIARRLADAPHQLVLGRSDGNREAGHRCLCRIEAPQTIQRNAKPLAGQVVQRSAERGLHRAVARERLIHLRLDIVDRPCIGLLDDGSEARERGDGGFRRLAIEPIWRCFSPPFGAVLGDHPHADQAVCARPSACDNERMLGVNRRDVVDDLHAVGVTPSRRAVHAVRYDASASGVPRKKAISASATS